MKSVKGSWTELGKAKLESSGLTVKIAEELGMYEVPSAAQVEDHFDALPSIIIPYYDIAGKPARSHPNWPEFYRLRYLAKGNSFKDLATDKSQRYAQPPNTGVCAYFPKTENWATISKAPKQAVIFTEGEFKAAAACMAGFPTIGLGGVWNFMAKREGMFFLPELEKFNWRRRIAYICFDSDYAENPNICAAMMHLCGELEERGALVRILLLPDVYDEENKKTGLDDYFLFQDAEEFEVLLDEAEPLGFAKSLWKLNEEVIYVEDPGLIVVESTGQKMAPSQFKEHSRWATTSYPARSINKDGNLVVKKEQAAPAWIKWPMRRSASRVTFKPGQPKITDSGEYNQWPGWGCEPTTGDIKPFTDLLDYLFKDADKGAKEWFLDWLAYPVQNPGVKMFSSAVVHGVVQGTGKSLIGYTMGQIYGRNFKEITDEDLEGGYTAWAENKQFVMGDEISGNDNRQFANMLKRLITQRSITINIKFVPQYDVPDCINYFFTSQHADAFFIEDTDRRYFIHEVTAEEPLPLEFYDRYDKWLWRDGGPGALFYWLMRRKFTKNPGTGQIFNPSAPAFKTRAKERMAMHSKGELSAWVSDLKQNADQLLRMGQLKHTRDLFTSKELMELYKVEYPEAKITSVGMGRALSTAGFPQVDGGQSLKGPDGKQARYFAVRNVKHWRTSKDRKAMEKNIAMQPTRTPK
jgi:hypothetical protein